MAAVGILMAAAGGRAASQQDFDLAPLEGVLAQGWEAREELAHLLPRHHMIPRVQEENPLVKLFLDCFRFFGWEVLRRQGSIAPYALRTPSPVRAPVPTGPAPCPAQIQTFQHQPKLGRIDLHLTLPRRRLRR